MVIEVEAFTDETSSDFKYMYLHFFKYLLGHTSTSHPHDAIIMFIYAFYFGIKGIMMAKFKAIYIQVRCDV